LGSGKTEPGAFGEALKGKHGELVESFEVLEDSRLVLHVEAENLLEFAGVLRDEYGFTIPIGGGAVDYLDQGVFEMNYYLNNPDLGFIAILRTKVDRGKPELASMTQVWEAMSFHERETHEMFGIDFKGHPNLVPLLLPPDWKGGYPLRKDFKGEGVED